MLIGCIAENSAFAGWIITLAPITVRGLVHNWIRRWAEFSRRGGQGDEFTLPRSTADGRPLALQVIINFAIKVPSWLVPSVAHGPALVAKPTFRSLGGDLKVVHGIYWAITFDESALAFILHWRDNIFDPLSVQFDGSFVAEFTSTHELALLCSHTNTKLWFLLALERIGGAYRHVKPPLRCIRFILRLHEAT
jgi:hypothetical protein